LLTPALGFILYDKVSVAPRYAVARTKEPDDNQREGHQLSLLAMSIGGIIKTAFSWAPTGFNTVDSGIHSCAVGHAAACFGSSIFRRWHTALICCMPRASIEAKMLIYCHR